MDIDPRYYTLNVMADVAIEKAKKSGIAIVFGGNHNDAGSFASYVYKLGRTT